MASMKSCAHAVDYGSRSATSHLAAAATGRRKAESTVSASLAMRHAIGGEWWQRKEGEDASICLLIVAENGMLDLQTEE
jgi:hypothetical protein